MTFIQPNKNKNLLNAILVVLVVLVVFCTFGMVALYNMTVNLSHNIATTKAELDAVGAQNTALNNKIIGTLGENNLADIATQDGLVTESQPQYFTIDPQWPIASHS